MMSANRLSAQTSTLKGKGDSLHSTDTNEGSVSLEGCALRTGGDKVALPIWFHSSQKRSVANHTKARDFEWPHCLVSMRCVPACFQNLGSRVHMEFAQMRRMEKSHFLERFMKTRLQFTQSVFQKFETHRNAAIHG